MKKGLFTLRGALTALFMAAFFVVAGSAFGPIKAEAASVSIKFKTSNEATDYQDYVEESRINILTGQYNRNVLRIRLTDTNDTKLKNVAASGGLKFMRTYAKKNTTDEVYTYEYSFYTTKNNKKSTFKFTVDGKQYNVRFFASKNTPVKKATFDKYELSTNSGYLGNAYYVTTLKKGKFTVKMNSGYSLVNVQVGKYKDSEDSALTWTTYNKSKMTVKLSSITPETSADEDDDTSKVSTCSMIAPTIIRVNYKVKSTGASGYVDYYLNRYIEADND